MCELTPSTNSGGDDDLQTAPMQDSKRAVGEEGPAQTLTGTEACGALTLDLEASEDVDVVQPGGREGVGPASKAEDDPEMIHAVPIHLRPDLLVPCADLVNAQWQRSQVARVHSLQKSCAEFPVCLVLLWGSGWAERLLGHARLSRVVGHRGTLFVESVVVSEAERGRGYGRILMEEVERYARRRGFSRLCLTTHDKQHFYAHLGYALAAPVQSAGAMTTFVPMAMLQNFSRMPAVARAQMETVTGAEMQQGGGDSGMGGVVLLPAAGSTFSPAPLTPLPHLPPSPSTSCVPVTSPGLLSPLSIPPPSPPPLSIPPPPRSMPPPPPLSIPLPPPPPQRSILPPPLPPFSTQSSGQQGAETLSETPYRDAKGVPIFWMHKYI